MKKIVVEEGKKKEEKNTTENRMNKMYNKKLWNIWLSLCRCCIDSYVRWELQRAIQVVVDVFMPRLVIAD